VSGRRSVLMALVGLLAFGAGTARAAPSVSFDASPSTARIGATVTFTGSATTDDGASIAALDWSFGDGATGSGARTSHTYNDAGNETVTLTATDSTGATGSARRTVRVVGDPVAAFSFSPGVPNVGDPVSFDGRASDDPGGSIASYRWSFGDGATGSGAQASHAYATSGDQTVTLTITAALDGRTDSVTRTVHVNVPPRATFVFAGVSAPPGQDPFTPVLGQQVAFSAQQSGDPDGSISSYAWDLGTGTFGAPTSVPWLLTTFSTAGPTPVRLRVTDNGGATATAQTTLRVNAPPAPGFGVAPSEPRTGETVTFTSTATDPDGAGDLASTSWDLNGDGTYGDATGPSAHAVFLTAGTYTINEKVVDKGGASRIATRRLAVVGPPEPPPTDPEVPVVPSPGGTVTVPFAPGNGGGTGASASRGTVTATTPGAATTAVVVRVLRGVRVQLAGSVTGAKTKITKMVVLAPAGALVVARCHGAGCPKQAVRRRMPASGRLRLSLLERRLDVGAEVVVSVAKSGYATRRTTLTMRRGRAPQRAEACVVPVPGGRPKVGACPA
jgi:PKD repeat protein